MIKMLQEQYMHFFGGLISVLLILCFASFITNVFRVDVNESFVQFLFLFFLFFSILPWKYNVEHMRKKEKKKPRKIVTFLLSFKPISLCAYILHSPEIL